MIQFLVIDCGDSTTLKMTLKICCQNQDANEPSKIRTQKILEHNQTDMMTCNRNRTRIGES
jgi:hypothetical protein